MPTYRDVFEIKAGDTRPVWRVQLTADDGSKEAPITDDLTGSVVLFRVKYPNATVQTFTGSVEDNALKIVRYVFQVADLAAVLTRTEVEYEVEVTLAGGQVMTFPTRGTRKAVFHPGIA